MKALPALADLPTLSELPPITYVLDLPKKARRPGGGGRGSQSAHGGLRIDRSVHDRLWRLVSRSPEAMVKITKKRWGAKSIANHLGYITRNGKLAAETDQGILLTTRQDFRDYAGMAMDAGQGVGDPRGGNRVPGQKRPSDAMSLIFSMPKGTTAEPLREAALAAARQLFKGHDWAFVLHTDKDHPHVHLLLKSHDDRGRRLPTEPADLHRWREVFAGELSSRGIAANATPRRSRGAGEKGANQAVYHLRQRRQSQVDKLQVTSATERHQRGEFKPKAWEVHAATRAATARAVLVGYAALLDRVQEPGDAELAKGLRDYALRMGRGRSAEQRLMAAFTGFLEERQVKGDERRPSAIGTREASRSREQSRDGGPER